VYNGGHSVAVTAGSAALGASKVDCTAPAYASCDILYASSTGTVAVTTDIFTAQAVGNTILAIIETSAGSVPTNIVLPLQSGSIWSGGLANGSTLTISTATVTSVRGLREEILVSGAGGVFTSGTVTGVRGAVTLDTALAAGASTYFYGTQGKLVTGTATLTLTNGMAYGLFGQLDVTGGTIVSGHIAAIGGDIFGMNSGSSDYVDMAYVQSAGGGVVNSMFKAFGKSHYVIDVSSNTHTQMSTTCQPAAISTTGALRVLVEGVERFIPLVAKGTCNGI
jgi:hypothetical protein